MVGFLLTGVLIGPSALGLVAETAAGRGLRRDRRRLPALHHRPRVLARAAARDPPRLLRRRLAAVRCSPSRSSAPLAFAFAGLPPPRRSSSASWSPCRAPRSCSSSTPTAASSTRRRASSLIGILLFQDFLIVPMIVLTPVLAGAVEASPLAIAAALRCGVAGRGRRGLRRRPLPDAAAAPPHGARPGIREVLVLGALLVCLGMAWFTESLGFSLALGAFLAGIVISESEYSHQVVAEVAPFRDVFNSVFFISIGMLLDLALRPAHHPAWSLGLTAAILVVKALAGGGGGGAPGLPGAHRGHRGPRPRADRRVLVRAAPASAQTQGLLRRRRSTSRSSPPRS